MRNAAPVERQRAAALRLIIRRVMVDSERDGRDHRVSIRANGYVRTTGDRTANVISTRGLAGGGNGGQYCCADCSPDLSQGAARRASYVRGRLIELVREALGAAGHLTNRSGRGRPEIQLERRYRGFGAGDRDRAVAGQCGRRIGDDGVVSAEGYGNPADRA